MSTPSDKPQPVIRFLFENSMFLVIGAVLAFAWANLHHKTYHHFVHEFDFRLFLWDHEELAAADHDRDEAKHAAPSTPDAHKGEGETGQTEHDSDVPDGEADGEPDDESPDHGSGHGHGITFHFIVNDVLMALFFAIAGKEVFESLLPGGALSDFRKAATPLMATLGGIVGPTLVYLLVLLATGRFNDLAKGWAVPCATDIAFSYLIGRLVFGAGHPAIAFLLLLAIADDAAGLIILALFYPKEPVELQWLLLTVASVLIAFALRRMKVQSFWWYLLIPGVLCWVSFYLAHLHPALGLVPIVFCMPHAHTDLGIFARDELSRDDTLNAFEHWWKNPVEIVLGLFGIANAGVVLSGLEIGTVAVLAGLLIGKPFGITALTWVADRYLGLEVPVGMTYRHIFVLGMVAAIGFTVALFMADAAFPIGTSAQDAAKMGALLSLGAAALAPLLARLLDIQPLKNQA